MPPPPSPSLFLGCNESKECRKEGYYRRKELDDLDRSCDLKLLAALSFEKKSVRNRIDFSRFLFLFSLEDTPERPVHEYDRGFEFDCKWWSIGDSNS